MYEVCLNFVIIQEISFVHEVPAVLRKYKEVYYLSYLTQMTENYVACQIFVLMLYAHHTVS